MKKITALILIILSFSFALPINECKTDIYFVNGVWNTEDQARDSAKKLYQIYELTKKYRKVKLLYNSHYGAQEDLLETFYQLKKEGQINNVEYFTLVSLAYGGNIPAATAALTKLMPIIKYLEEKNVEKLVSNVYNNRFKYSHRVLLVSHSQGNLFANRINRIFDSLFPKEYQDYLANVQVASPANSVHAKMGTYITGWIDPVINPIPGSMPANADLDSPGHGFVTAYLASKDTYNKIVAAIKQQLSNLDKIKSMWELNTSNMTCGSCKEEDIKITAQHRFDKSISDIKVFPFNPPAYKIYPLEGKYVAAKCGGTSIVAQDNPNICYSIENTNEYIPKMESLIKGVCIGIVDSDINYRFNPDTKELLVGTIGNNYWLGHCTHYKRHILLFVKNEQYLNSVKLNEVGFDDWIQLSIDGSPFYIALMRCLRIVNYIHLL